MDSPSSYSKDPESKSPLEAPETRGLIYPTGAAMKSSTKTTIKEVLPQILAGLAANLASIAPGMTLGFSAVAIPQLQDPNSSILINEDEASWVASIAAIATPIGALLGGLLMERAGRRGTLLLLSAPLILGWVLIATALNLNMILAGRFFTGLGTGIASSPGQVYIGETSIPSVRSMLACWNSIAISFGILLVYVLGSLVDWRMVAGISAIFPVISYVALSLVPESPSWLVRRGRIEDAETSLRWLRRCSVSVQVELQELVASQSESTSFKSSLNQMRKPSCYKPFVILTTFFFFQQFSGIYVIIFYAVNIVKDAGVTFNEYIATILIGLTRMLITIIISAVLGRIGRRPPSIVSGIGMTLAMAALGVFLHFSPEGLSWVPLVCIVVYVLTSTIGFLTIPWAMISELYPARIRGIASGATTCLTYTFSFIVVKIYPSLVHLLGKPGVFDLFAAISAVGTLFVIFFLPETKGKTLNEIEEYFTKRDRSRESQRMLRVDMRTSASTMAFVQHV